MDERTEKKQSIQDKINEMKQKKQEAEKKSFVEKLKEASKRSLNNSRLKITFTNDKDNYKNVYWVISPELMKYTILDGMENVCVENVDKNDFMGEFLDMFYNYWSIVEESEREKSGAGDILEEEFKFVGFHNLFFSVDLWEDLECPNADLYKRKSIYNNLNIAVAGLFVREIMEQSNLSIVSADKVFTRECIQQSHLNPIMNNFVLMILECLLRLEKSRLPNQHRRKCSCCEEKLKIVEVAIYEAEISDLLTYHDIDYNKLHTELLGSIEEMEQSIKSNLFSG